MINPFRFSTRQRSPFLLKRLGYWMSRLGGTRLQKAKSLHFVSVNGHCFKRLIFCDSFLASEIEQHLDCFADSGYFPPLVARYEREIWLEYVEGIPIRSVDEPFVHKIAAFYATVYGVNPILLKTKQSPFPGRLLQDLRFLHQVGILPQAFYLNLQSAAHDLAPEHIWVGYDYTDPVLKNFILQKENGRICVVDVDGLAGNQLLGIGVAKACVRWLGPYQAVFFSSLANQGAPDFQQYFSFVELCFLAKWTKRAFLEHDWKVIDSTLFERFRLPSSNL